MNHLGIFQNLMYDCELSGNSQKCWTVQSFTCVAWVLNHKIMQEFHTQSDPVHLTYKLNVLCGDFLSSGCNSFSAYEMLRNILSEIRV